MALPQRVLGSQITEIGGKYSKNHFLQSHLPQMLEIRYVALPSVP